MTDNSQLSERESEILRLVATGASNKEIARELYISTNTVKVHLRNIFAKIDAASRTEAAMYAVQIGLVEAGPNGGVNTELGNVPIRSTGEITAAGAENAWWKRSFAVWAIVIIGLLGIGVSVVFALRQSSPTADNVQNDSPDPSRWQEMAPMPTARSGFAAVAYENTIYAIAGETEETVVGVVERYIPNEDRWEKLASKPTAVGDVGGVVIGGRIFVPGGRLPSGEITDRLEIFDPQTNEWQSGTSIPIPVSAYAIATFEGKLYLFGGWDGEKYLDEIIEYDPDNNQWIHLEKLNNSRAYAGAAVIGNKIYIFGGFDGLKALSSGEVFTPDISGGKLEAWDMGEPAFAARYGMGVAEIADIVYVIGGEGELREDQEDVAYFHQTNEWQSIPAPKFELVANLRLVSLGNYLYLMGGSLNGVPSDRNYVYEALYTVSVPLIINR